MRLFLAASRGSPSPLLPPTPLVSPAATRQRGGWAGSLGGRDARGAARSGRRARRRQTGREGRPGPHLRLPVRTVFLNGTLAAPRGRLPPPPVYMAPVPVPLIYQETADGRFIYAGQGSNTDRSFLPGPVVARPARAAAK